MPVFVPKRVASWWSGASSSVISHPPRASGIRTLCARASVVLLRMDSRRVLVCYWFGSIRRNVRVQASLVLLSLVCVGRVCGMRVSPRVRAVCGLLWHIVLFWVSLPIRWSILFSFWRAAAGGASRWWWFLWPARVQLPLLLIRLPYRSLLSPCVLGPTKLLCSPFDSRRETTSPLPRIPVIYIGSVLVSLPSSPRLRMCCRQIV